eukprot:GHVP01017501.1.p1 GENE.GHVP01017501.1~~GHVP01017501.1.p1  ORF type:complete len:201 (+),score=54.32 GHVP01017501.1:292-894(+)
MTSRSLPPYIYIIELIKRSRMGKVQFRGDYKERPLKEGKYMLERKEEYKIRAKNRHEKENRIKELKEEILNKNEDEFYFGMIRSKLIKGEHVKEDKELLPYEKKIMTNQDNKYIELKNTVRRKKIEKLKEKISVEIGILKTKEKLNNVDAKSRIKNEEKIKEIKNEYNLLAKLEREEQKERVKNNNRISKEDCRIIERKR